MNPARLLLVFALLAGSSYAGPFGLKPTMEVEDANKVGATRKVNGFIPFVKTQHEIYSHRSVFKNPPGQITSTFKTLRALFTEEMGLIGIESEGFLKTQEGKAKFAEIVKTLTDKYGEPSSIKQYQLNRLSAKDGLTIATWPSKKREEGIFDLAVELKKSPVVYYLKIRYWFVPESYVMRKVVKAKQEEKSAKEAKAKKELDDL